MRSVLLLLVLPACQVIFPLQPDIPDIPDVAPVDEGLILHLTFDELTRLNDDELDHTVTCIGSCGQQTDDPHGSNEAIAFTGATACASSPRRISNHRS